MPRSDTLYYIIYVCRTIVHLSLRIFAIHRDVCKQREIEACSTETPLLLSRGVYCYRGREAASASIKARGTSLNFVHILLLGLEKLPRFAACVCF